MWEGQDASPSSFPTTAPTYCRVVTSHGTKDFPRCVIKWLGVHTCTCYKHLTWKRKAKLHFQWCTLFIAGDDIIFDTLQGNRFSKNTQMPGEKILTKKSPSETSGSITQHQQEKCYKAAVEQ